MNSTTLAAFLTGLFLFLPSCSLASDPPPGDISPPLEWEPERVALEKLQIPADNPITPGKVELGKQLFFDKRLSATGEMSCETCHQPENGWADSQPTSARHDGALNARHTPTLYNAGYYREWFWDGRAQTLERAILDVWREQMGADPEQIAAALNAIDGYRRTFELHMDGPANPERIAKALATFVRTITSDGAPWDHYENGNLAAVSEEAIAGFEVFSRINKGRCTSCHLPPLYTDTLYHNTGVGYDQPDPDPGRAMSADGAVEEHSRPFWGAFKTPSLRGVTETAPYFHDGRAKTLEDAVDLMLKGGIQNPDVDPRLSPRQLRPEERSRLLAFLRSLTPEPKPFERPQLP